MRLIAHRGNINGRLQSHENEPTYIDIAIKKDYDVEVDVWYKDGVLWLGHDKPDYGMDFKWFLDRISKLWIHCKNIEAVLYFKECEYAFNYFWHQEDDIALTSFNFIWAYPGKQPIEGSIAVMPEINNDDVSKCFGICSDHIINYNTNK
jgi:hypothetical protein